MVCLKIIGLAVIFGVDSVLDDCLGHGA